MMQKRCSFSDCDKHIGPASAIRINVVQSRCNRSVERSRYAESLSDEREQ
jgi:hypothetical protein